MNQCIQMGQTGRPHGLKGFLHLYLHNADSVSLLHSQSCFFFLKKALELEDLQQLKQLEKQSDANYIAFRLNQIQQHGSSVLIQIDGIDSRNQATRYVNKRVYLPRAWLPEAKDDTYYYSDLVHCQCILNGKVVATVVEVNNFGSCDLLKIDCLESEKTSKTKKVIYIPFLKKYCGKIDIENKSIELLNDAVGFFEI